MDNSQVFHAYPAAVVWLYTADEIHDGSLSRMVSIIIIIICYSFVLLYAMPLMKFITDHFPSSVT